MPKREVHTLTGVAAGAVYAFHRSKGRPDPQRLAEILGGMAGSYGGSLAPDLVESARRNPRHRGIFHSEAPAVILIRVKNTTLHKWEGWCRTHADRLRAEADALPADSFVRLFKRVLAFLCDMLAAALGGFIVGYLSHLALDFGSPASVGLVSLCK